MDEFELIKNYFQKISKNNPSAKKLNDDVFFDKKNKLVVSVDTYNEGIHFPNFKYPNLVVKKIIINEYLRASNFFIEDGQTKYLNALLDKISKKIRNSNG